MEKGNRWTLDMLEAFLSVYQTLVTIITFFAGFVFATIPVVLFAVELSSVYGRLIIYFLLTPLLIFIIMIDLYRSATMIIAHQTSPTLT